MRDVYKRQVLDTVKVLEFFLNSAPVAEIAPPQRPELLTKLERCV